MKTRKARGNRAFRRDLLKIYRRLLVFFGPQRWWPGDTPFEVMVGAILTQNTAWSNVEKAINNLKRAGALSSPVAMDRVTVGRLALLIKSAGYYNIKSQRLKNFLSFLRSGYGHNLRALSEVGTPRLRQDLLSVNGIGPETADSMLLYALGRTIFVIDAYTRRIFSRHHIIDKESSYDELQAVFMDSLPRDKKLYNEYHALIVRLGKEYCRAKPRCGGCPLGSLKIPCK